MPSLDVLLIRLVMVSVMFLMLGVGLGTEFSQVLEVVRKLKLLAVGILANFLVVPVLICLFLIWLPLSPDIKIGILLMAAAPIAPMAPPFVGMAKGDVAYSVGLMTIVALLSVLLTPFILALALPESLGGVELDPMQIVKTLVTAQIIPISIGMGVRQASPSWAEKLLKFVPRIGQIGLIIGVGLILAQQAKDIISMGVFVHLFLVALVVASLLIGDWMLLGESPERRRSLAVSTAIRNVPLAFLIAGENFPGTVVAPVVLLFGTYTMIFSIAYGKVMTARQTQAAES